MHMGSGTQANTVQQSDADRTYTAHCQAPVYTAWTNAYEALCSLLQTMGQGLRAHRQQALRQNKMQSNTLMGMPVQMR